MCNFRKRKSIILLLVILTFHLTMYSCAGKTNSYANANGSESDSRDIADITTIQESTKISPDLPEKDFGNYEFKIITSDYTADRNMPQEIGAEQENGDPVNDAIYRRNKKIEEQYNVKIKEILYARDQLNEPVKKSIQAGDVSYDLICGNLRQLGILSQAGNLLDLTQVGYLDLKKPWYDQKAANELSIGKKLYFAVGELQISDNDGTWGVLFNKKLLKNLALEDPYTLVENGKWTMDKLFELALVASKDINGDSIMNEEDQWGIVGEGFDVYALMNGAGTRLVQKDENDLPFYAGYTSIDIDIFYKGAEYLGNKTKTLLAENYNSKYTNVWTGLIDPIFDTDRVLFFFTSLSRVTLHRGFETDFGILPVPKYNEEQKDYVNTVSVWLASGISMPITLTGESLERAAIITEALSAESMYTLTPAYYDVQLKSKLTRDNESSKMLDIIFANRTYSTPHLYDWGGMISTIQDLLKNDNRNFVSAMDKIEGKINADIAKTIAAYMK